MAFRIILAAGALWVVGCNTPATGGPAPSSLPAAPSASTTAPSNSTAAPSAPSSEPPTASERCMSPAQSQDRAKPHKNADPPYAECAAGVFSHCEPDDAYCSRPLDVKLTWAERKKVPNVCCY